MPKLSDERVEISMSRLRAHELEQLDGDAVNNLNDPETLIINRVSEIASQFGLTEAEAEALYLGKLEQMKASGLKRLTLRLKRQPKSTTRKETRTT